MNINLVQRRLNMMRYLSIPIVAAVLTCGSSAYAQAPDNKNDTKGKVCRMEQQCHWENFKKVCTYVKVCR
jgi:hypothetical protein